MENEQIHFVTGKLAAVALRAVVDELAKKVGFGYTVQVLPITVAALLTTKWIAPRLEIPEGTTKVILPGYSEGPLEPIREKTEVAVEFGPKDLRKLPAHFGHKVVPNLDVYDIQIIAEINHAPRKSLDEILAMARQMKVDGANFIDVGCEPNSCWDGVGDCVKALIDQGFIVSVDSLNPVEIENAVSAGATLVLSVNESNRERAVDWGVEVVAIPDDIARLESLEPTIEFLEKNNVPFRMDPILEPIGFGFAKSLNRYMEARRRWPKLEMMMGIGNLTELSDVDSAGVNFLLISICQELGIRSILTTEVINWARTSVRECDVARRIAHHSITRKVPPKHLSTDLVQLRDAQLLKFGLDQIEQMSNMIKDNNYRIFAEQNEVHLVGSKSHFRGNDPFEVFDRLRDVLDKDLGDSHAFYLGYELCKANIAATLGKQYTQDEALDWGHLTIEEKDRHRISRRKKRDGETPF